MALGFGVRINEVDRTPQTRANGSFRVEYQLGALARCTLETRDVDSLATAYRPAIDQRLAITGPPEIGQRLIFNGMILKVEDGPLLGPHVGTLTRVDAVSNWRAASKRRVSATFPAGAPLKNHVNYLTVTYLQDFNIYIDPGMPDGPIMGAIVYDQMTVEAAMNHLADLTGWVYRLRPATPNDVLEMFPIGWALRPIHLSGANKNIIGSVTWGRTREVYLNRVILRYGTGLVSRRQTFVGDGVTRAFPLGDSAGGPPGPFVNYYGGGGTINISDEWTGDGVNLSFPMRRPFIYTPGTFVTYYGDTYPPEGGLEAVGNPGDGLPWHHDPLNNLVRNPGIPGPSNPPGINVKFTYGYQTEGHEEGCARPGDGMPWYVDPQNNLIRDPGIPGISNPPAAGVVIEYTHNVQFPRTVIAEDEADIALHGVWEDLFDAAEVFETADAQATAESLLRKYLPTPRRVVLRTRFAVDFLPGDTVELLDVPERTLPVGPYLVTATTVEADADQELTTTLTLLEGDTAQDSWLDFWRSAFGSGSNAGVVTGSVQPSPGPGGGGGGGGGTGDLTGTGTPPQLAVWTGTKVLADSGISASGGNLTGGSTGAGFTINLTASTVVGTLPLANIPVLPKTKLPTTVAYTDQINNFTAGPQRFTGSTGDRNVEIIGSAGTNWAVISLLSSAVGNPLMAQLHADPNTFYVYATKDLFLQALAGNIWLNVGGGLVLPQNAYHTSLGMINRKYLALHAAELWVETLVAQDTIATIGGRVLVGPTTILTRDVAPTDSVIYVKHRIFTLMVAGVQHGSSVMFEAAGKFEVMSISRQTQPAAEPDGSYAYDVYRNWDHGYMAGGAGDQWYAGDAAFDSGSLAGAGWIDLYALRGVRGVSEAGPTIVGNIRKAGVFPGQYWSDYAPRWAVGHLAGLYGYPAGYYGAAFGVDTGLHVTIDDANGFIIRHGPGHTPKFHADINGNLTLSGDLTIGAAGVFRTASATDFTHGIGIYMAGGPTPVWRVGDPNDGVWPSKSMSWDGATLRVGFWTADGSNFNGDNIKMNASGLFSVGGASTSGFHVSGYSSTARLWLGTVVQDSSGWLFRVGPSGYIQTTDGIGATGSITSAGEVRAHQVFRFGLTATAYLYLQQLGTSMWAAGAAWQLHNTTSEAAGGGTPNALFPSAHGAVILGQPTNRWATVYANAVDAPSDRTVKTAIRPGSLGLAFLERLPVHRFTYTDDPGQTPGQYGFMTDEVRAALAGEPFAHLHDHGLDYARFVPVLTKAIQELAARVRELEQ